MKPGTPVGGSATPGTPDASSEPAMDYAGRGRNRLISVQKHSLLSSNLVEVTEFGYRGQEYHDQNHITSREFSAWEWVDGQWRRTASKTTKYDYQRGQVRMVKWTETAFEEGVPTSSTSWAEYFHHDLFGRICLPSDSV